MTLQEAWPFLEAAKNGKTLQMQVGCGTSWEDINELQLFNCLSNSFCIRIKPEPRKVPLEMSDIDLHRDLFRHEDGMNDPVTAWSVGEVGVWIGLSTVAITFVVLQKKWERSTDGGKTWQRCEKEVA